MGIFSILIIILIIVALITGKGILRTIISFFAITIGGLIAIILGLIGAILLPFFFKGKILNNQFYKMKGGYAEYLVALIAKIAKLDGVVSTKEAEFIKLMLDKNSYNLVERERLKQIYKESKENPHNYQEVALKLMQEFNLSKGESLKIMQSLLYCASIDGFSKTKVSALKQIAEILGVAYEFSQFLNQGHQSQSQSPKKDPYEVLELSSNASFTQIKAAYRRLVRKYHPDILNTQNLSEEEIKKGIEKFHEINDAYDYLKEKFNQ